MVASWTDYYCSSVGFLGTSIDVVRLFLKYILSTKPWLQDPEVVSIPWQQEMEDSLAKRATKDGDANEQTLLKIGVLWTDGIVRPQLPILHGF